MTNGSCHSTHESKVQPCENPPSSALRRYSTTSRAGGSVCRTRPKSITGVLSSPHLGSFCVRCGTAAPQVRRLGRSDEVLAEVALEEPAVAGAAAVPGPVDDHATAGQHGVDPAGDVQALVGGVVD